MTFVGIALLLVSAGCPGAPSAREQREEQDPLLVRARAKRRAQDIDGAIALYRKALDRDPDLARAHLELGLLYDGVTEDYIQAIFHYESYLELRPKTEKRELIEDLVRRAKISYAATLPDRPSAAVEEIADLKKENKMLRERLKQAEAARRKVEDEFEAYRNRAQRQQQAATRSTQRTPAATAAPASRASRPVAPAPAPAQSAVQTYRVRRGDTLSSIATRMYDDPAKWSEIYEANRASLKSPESIRVGQTLIIPR